MARSGIVNRLLIVAKYGEKGNARSLAIDQASREPAVLMLTMMRYYIGGQFVASLPCSTTYIQAHHHYCAPDSTPVRGVQDIDEPSLCFTLGDES